MKKLNAITRINVIQQIRELRLKINLQKKIFEALVNFKIIDNFMLRIFVKK